MPNNPWRVITLALLIILGLVNILRGLLPAPPPSPPIVQVYDPGAESKPPIIDRQIEIKIQIMDNEADRRFYKLHPELKRKLRASDSSALKIEWLRIREQVQIELSEQTG
jgi:hypothetical protein